MDECKDPDALIPRPHQGNTADHATMSVRRKPFQISRDGNTHGTALSTAPNAPEVVVYQVRIVIGILSYNGLPVGNVGNELRIISQQSDFNERASIAFDQQSPIRVCKIHTRWAYKKIMGSAGIK